MAEIVNLRLARKAKARAGKEEVAAQNRTAFGQSKAERERKAAEAALEGRKLDGHRRGGSSDEEPRS